MIKTQRKETAETPTGKRTHGYRQISHRQAEKQYLRYKYQKRVHSLVLMVAIMLAFVGINGYKYFFSQIEGLKQFRLERFFPKNEAYSPRIAPKLSFREFAGQLNIVPMYINFLPVSLNFSQALTPDSSPKLLPIMAQQEDTELKAKLERLFARYPSRFVPHLYYFNPQDQQYTEINGFDPVSAASVIKLPLLFLYFQNRDANLFNDDTRFLFQEYHRAGGSGELQYRPAGEIIPASQIARQMIQISDNTCTNMMIAYLGGTELVNQKLEALGLAKTKIRNWLPDLEGTNTISPYEMATILYNFDQGSLLSQNSRGNALDVLEGTHNRRLLPALLPKGTLVAHKTGDIGTALGDSGIVYLPNQQKHYILSVQVERSYNDYTAREMIQQASQIVYDHVAGR